MKIQTNNNTALQNLTWPKHGLERVLICPVCGCGKSEVLYENLVDNVFQVAPGLWSFSKCNNCSSIWLDPRPTRETISIAYKQYYTHEQFDHPIVRRIGLFRSFIHDAMNDYRNNKYLLDRKPFNRLGRYLIPLLPSLKHAIDSECRHLSLPPAGGRLLDIGFGNGGFLKTAKEMGWQAEGVDFDPKAVETARSRGLTAFLCNTETFNYSENTFDIVTLSHVLEHVHNPELLIQEIFRILKPEGILWLDTPNQQSFGHQYFRCHWRGLETPRHLTIFNYDSLTSILKKYGFDTIKRHWRGLSVFDVFPASQAIAESKDPLRSSRNGKPFIRELFAEIFEWLVPKRREFITLTARKKHK